MTDQTLPHIVAAKTIMAQMGRGRPNALAVMVGAKNFVGHEDERGALSFRVPMKTKDGSNYVKVTLTWMDTYRVEFGHVWGSKYVVLSTHEDVYCDGLADLFESTTGLYLTF